MCMYVVDADVERFVDDDPRDCLLTTRLRQWTIVRYVVIGLCNKTLYRNVPHSRLLTYTAFYRSSSTNICRCLHTCDVQSMRAF